MVAIELKSLDEARALFGPRDRHLRLVRERFHVQIVARDGQIKVQGSEEQEKAAAQVLGAMLASVRADGRVSPETLDELQASPKLSPKRGQGKDDEESIEGIKARTPGQKRYIDALKYHDMVFAIGPAGTGKTFLGVAMAVRALKRGIVSRIILSRPAVEAGEKLGFLPGDIQAKVNPYLRPLYDALNDILGFETVKKYIEREVIEIVPLAYMRGRTLNRSFIILDEAQNTTKAQMKMFLTRMGEGSRIVVTGDVTQVDLPPKQKSGLIHAQRILQGVEGISFQHLTSKDIVRHPLVWKIVHAYEGQPQSQDE
ncbi:MAG TPA: PhoH family protein [Planctomycetota bacterium]|nr:PhoH family protein [Planctomycetota bacterium]